MEKCTCFKCNKLFFYNPKSVPYRKSEDGVLGRTLYYKIMSCPYCEAAMMLSKYYEEWD